MIWMITYIYLWLGAYDKKSIIKYNHTEGKMTDDIVEESALVVRRKYKGMYSNCS